MTVVGSPANLCGQSDTFATGNLALKRFGTLLQEARRDQGLTLEEVARRARTHKGYISSIERGKVNPPSAALVVRLAKILGLDPREMLKRAWVQKAPKEIREELMQAIFGVTPG